MLGLMMRTPLLLSILTHAARSFPDVEVVSRAPHKANHAPTVAARRSKRDYSTAEASEDYPW